MTPCVTLYSNYDTPQKLAGLISKQGTALSFSYVYKSNCIARLAKLTFNIISTTSRLYIGLAVRLYRCLSIFHVFSLVFKLLYLCRERPDQESE